MTIVANQTEWMLQLMSTGTTKEEMTEQLAAVRLQDGFRGGRVIPPSPEKPGWRMQAFFTDDAPQSDWMPDGMRRVVILPALRKELGILD